MNLDIYYDKECPFCKQYAKLMALKKNHNVSIKNAREYKSKIIEFNNLGFNINEGLIVVCEEKIYHGSDAVIFLDKLDKLDKTGIKISLYDNILFKKVLYPIVKFIRYILLKILGKNPNIL